MRLIYFHICPIGLFADIISKMMNKIQSSGLLDDVNELRYVLLGDINNNVTNTLTRYGETFTNVIRKDSVRQALRIMQSFPKTRCIAIDPEINLYERATLHRLLEDCKEMETSQILYIHSKGVSRDAKVYPGVDQWRNTMLEGLTTYRHLCWKYLERGAAAVGNYVHGGGDTGWPSHFSGNFWWSTQSHIASLGTIPCQNFNDPEMWIIGHQPGISWVCIRNRDSDLYYDAISMERYLSSVCFESNFPIPRSTIILADISLIDMGFGDEWVRCHTNFSPGTTISLSASNLGVTLSMDRADGLFGIAAKIVRVHHKSGQILYFFENEMVDML